MGYSQAQKAESRQKVLDVAARQIREHGLESLGVADCMRQAGLTHGAFYGHFSSRDALIVAALEHAVAQSKARIARVRGSAASGEGEDADTKPAPLRAIAEAFLSERHLNNPGEGCALCALAGEARYATPEVRERLTHYVESLTAQIAQTLSEENRSVAPGIVATIVGAVTIARAVDNDALAKSMLDASLAFIMSAQNPLPGEASHGV